SSGTSFLLRSESDIVFRSLNVIIGWDVVILPGIGIAAFFVVRNILRDCKALEKAASEVSRGELEYRIADVRTTELGIVADQFNNMTERLREAEAKMRAQT